MTIFSCKTECKDDVDAFIRAAELAGVEMKVLSYPDCCFPDIDMEIHSDVSTDVLRGLMRRCEEALLMRQTLRAVPLEENSLKCDERVR